MLALTCIMYPLNTNWIVIQNSSCNKITVQVLCWQIKFSWKTISKGKSLCSRNSSAAKKRSTRKWKSFISSFLDNLPIEFNNVNNIKANERESWKMIWFELHEQGIWFNATLLVNFTLTIKIQFNIPFFHFASQSCTM